MAENIIETYLRAEALKRLNRTGWDIAGVIVGRKESVAEHSWGTTFLALLISNQLLENGIEFELSKVLSMAAIHDISEAITSDIPYSAILLAGDPLKKGKSIAEKEAVNSIFSSLGTHNEKMVSVFQELQKGESIESRIVLSSDILDMLLHAIGLERNGVNAKILDQFFTTGLSRIKSFDIPIAIKIATLLYEEHTSLN